MRYVAKEVVTLQLNKDFREELRRVAILRGQSLSEMVGDFLRALLSGPRPLGSRVATLNGVVLSFSLTRLEWWCLASYFRGVRLSRAQRAECLTRIALRYHQKFVRPGTKLREEVLRRYARRLLREQSARVRK